MAVRHASASSVALAAASALALCAAAHGAEPSVDELRELSIEQLANLQITSVSRRPEAVARAPAAIDVITSEDIRRLGVQSLPEVLRLARNLEVARVSSQHYAISARGFNTFQAANKLLVLIDGRSVYTPLYSGVLWDQQILFLQDIERIEVISGPGGTLWGANAVNGVINVISKSAADTQGVLAEALVGSVDQRLDLRYGGRLRSDGGVAYRVFASAFGRGSMLTTTGEDAGDEWSAGQVGLRADWGDADDRFMLQGAFHDRLDSDGESSGGHALGSWNRLLRNGSNLAVQAYYWNTSAAQGGVSDALDTVDLEFQHTLSVGSAHQIVWGGGYRHNESEFVNTNSAAGLVQDSRTLHTSNLFLQDEIALADHLALTLGFKVEDHTFTGVEYLPNVRLAGRPTDASLVWAAVSRAVRTPSRIDRELTSPGVILPSGESFTSEDLLAYELGYRMQPTRNSTFSVTAFLHEYDGLRTLNFSPPAPGALPVSYGNGMDGEVYGLEASGDVAITDAWSVSAGVTLLEQEFDIDPLTIDFNGSGDDPEHQLFLRSRMDLASNVELDLDVRSIAEVSPIVPGYTELGARLAFRLNDRAEVAIAGFNLLDEAHPESFDEGDLLQARRSVQVGLRLTY